MKHDAKSWECDVCKKSFTTKYFLRKHKRLHTGTRTRELTDRKIDRKRDRETERGID
jgi:hypothetical protein